MYICINVNSKGVAFCPEKHGSFPGLKGRQAIRRVRSTNLIIHGSKNMYIICICINTCRYGSKS